MKNSEKYSIVPGFIRDKFREYRKTKEDQESPKEDEKREKENATMGEGYKKGGMVRAKKKAPVKMAKGGMMCSPRKKMAMGGMVKGYKKGGMVSRSGCK